jgi:adenosylcobinamide-GDP ribazoletransferase
MKSFFCAFQFLTRLPLRIDNLAPEDMPRSVAWFPAVGLFIGGVLFVVGFDAAFLKLPAEMTAALLILLLVAVTGGLHLDGLSDTADGFYAGKTKEDVLRIMDDSHVGAMGVVAIATVLLLKYAVLVSLLKALDWRAVTASLLVVPVASRWAMAVSGAFLGPAKQDGLAHLILAGLKARHWLFATLIAAGIVAGLMGFNAIVLCLSVLLVTLVCLITVRNRIGGLTGDTLGMINELTELCGFFACYMMYRT